MSRFPAMVNRRGLWTPPGSINNPINNYGPHIVDWVTLPRDNVYIVPDGNYDLTNWDTLDQALLSGAETSGAYGGWIILMAQNHLGAKMTSTPYQALSFVGSGGSGNIRDYRIAFVGFDFSEVHIHIKNSRHLRFIHTEHTATPIGWWSEYHDVRGGTLAGTTADRDILNSITRWPSAFRIEPDFGVISQFIQILGADIHDVCDDGIYTSFIGNSLIQGSKFWRIGSTGYDPGTFPKDFFHSDGIQVTGTWTHNTVRDSWWGSTNSTEAYANGNISYSKWLNMWFAGAPGWPMSLTKKSIYWINKCEITGLRAFANGQGWDNSWNPHYNAANDIPLINVVYDTNDSMLRSASWPSTLQNTNFADTTAGGGLGYAMFDCPVSGVVTTVPSDVAVSGGALVNGHNDIKNSVFNPANIWRAAHPYASTVAWLTNEYGWHLLPEADW